MRSEFDEVFKDAYDYWIDDVDIHRYEAATGLADQIWHHQQSKLDELQLKIKRLIESEENIARGCEAWRNAHRKADERVDELQKRVDLALEQVEYFKSHLDSEQKGFAALILKELEQALTPQKGGTSQ